MEVEVKNLRRGQWVYDVFDKYVIYSAPALIDGKWLCDATADGDCACRLHEGHELFDNYELK